MTDSATKAARPAEVPETPPARVTAIGSIVVVTSDLDRFRTFYQGLLGLPHVITLRMAHPPFLVHGVFAVGRDTVLRAVELPGYDPVADGIGTTFGHRGRLDQVALLVDDEPALRDLRDRLVAAGASDGAVTPMGPYLSVPFRDPDGLEGEVTCPDPSFDPSRAGDEVIECSTAPQWTAGLMTR